MQLRRDQRKDRLAEIAFRHIAKYGLFEFSLHKVAQDAELPYSYVYRNFKRKGDLLAYSWLKGLDDAPAFLEITRSMPLSGREKLLLLTCVPFYYSSLENEKSELIFRGLYSPLIGECSPIYIEALKASFDKLTNARRIFIEEILREETEGTIDTTSVNRKLQLITRGSIVNAYLQKHTIEKHSLIECLQLADDILSLLNWKTETSSDIHKLMAIIRTLSDRNFK